MQFIPEGAIRLNMALVYGVCTSLKYITDKFPSHEDCAIEYHHPIYLNDDGTESIIRISHYGHQFILNTEDFKYIGVHEKKIEKHKLKVEYFKEICMSAAAGGISGYEVNLVCAQPERFKNENFTLILQPPYNKCLQDSEEEHLPSSGPYDYPLNVQDVSHRVRQALATGTVSSFIIGESTGSIIHIPQEIWRTQLADYIIEHDAPAVFIIKEQVFSGKVLVPFDDFARVFHFSDSNSLKSGAYVPPYIGFALQAVADLNLSHDQRMPKKQIEYWLEKNWPREMLGDPSKTKIEYMATFLRHPEDENAGAFRSDRRSLRPGLQAITDSTGK